MKRTLFIFILISTFSQFSNAQLIVSDPGVYAKMLEQTNNTIQTIEKATAQLEVTEKQLSIAKKAGEKLQKVKSAISQGKMIKKIISNFKEIGKGLLGLTKQISRIDDMDDMQFYTEKYEDIEDELEILTQLVSQTLTSNVLDSSDIDRVKFLKDLYFSTKKLKQTTKSLVSQIILGM